MKKTVRRAGIAVAFAAPAATGCDVLPPAVNAALDLPSESGRDDASLWFYLVSLNYTKLP